MINNALNNFFLTISGAPSTFLSGFLALFIVGVVVLSVADFIMD